MEPADLSTVAIDLFVKVGFFRSEKQGKKRGKKKIERRMKKKKRKRGRERNKENGKKKRKRTGSGCCSGGRPATVMVV